MLTKTRILEIRSLLMGLACIIVASVAIANLYCALVYGAVFLIRGQNDWVWMDSGPVAFIISVVMSLIAAPAFALLGITAILGVRTERRLYQRASRAPRFEDPSKTSRL